MGGWSPEIVSGKLKHDNDDKPVISHEAIYQWIYTSAPHLIECLPRAHRSRYPRCSRRGKVKIPDRVSISERPAEVPIRVEPGHWETDQMVSKSNKLALQVCAERTSRLTVC